MKTNAELMDLFQKELDALWPKAESGDEDAQIEWAIGKALHHLLASGHKLTDLDWFKHTPYYTGGSSAELKKAA